MNGIQETKMWSDIFMYIVKETGTFDSSLQVKEVLYAYEYHRNRVLLVVVECA